jgi:hypothetical protein
VSADLAVATKRPFVVGCRTVQVVAKGRRQEWHARTQPVSKTLCMSPDVLLCRAALAAKQQAETVASRGDISAFAAEGALGPAVWRFRNAR